MRETAPEAADRSEVRAGGEDGSVPIGTSGDRADESEPLHAH